MTTTLQSPVQNINSLFLSVLDRRPLLSVLHLNTSGVNGVLTAEKPGSCQTDTSSAKEVPEVVVFWFFFLDKDHRFRFHEFYGWCWLSVGHSGDFVIVPHAVSVQILLLVNIVVDLILVGYENEKFFFSLASTFFFI